MSFSTGDKPATNAVPAAHIPDLPILTGGHPPTRAEFDALAATLDAVQTVLIGAGIRIDS